MAYTRKIRRLKRRLWAKGEEYVSSKQVSPVEARLVEALGGKTMTIDRIGKHEFERPVTLILRQPKILKREHFTRTGDSLILYSNDLKYAIGIRGREYERDVIGAWERDEKLKAEGWVVKYIPIEMLARNPDQVRNDISQFIYA